MSLLRGELNPLSVLKLRKLTFIPNHFSTILINNQNIDINLLDHWINFNLNSRYAIIKKFVVNQNKQMKEVYEVGLEDKKELTMFSLGCPYLHK